jgi:hypothetical protein
MALIERVLITPSQVTIGSDSFECFLETNSVNHPIVCLADNQWGGDCGRLIPYARPATVNGKNGVRLSLLRFPAGGLPLHALEGNIAVNLLQEGKGAQPYLIHPA